MLTDKSLTVKKPTGIYHIKVLKNNLMANFITSIRIICSVILLFVPSLSTWFYVLYIAAGLSDMLDGLVARRTKTTSQFGAMLDSIADVIFLIVCLFKILPCLHIELWLWIAAIAALKLFNLASGIILYKKVIMPHTVANKITGLYLFLAPVLMLWVVFIHLAIILCAVAAFAAIEEGYSIIKTKNEYIKLF